MSWLLFHPNQDESSGMHFPNALSKRRHHRETAGYCVYTDMLTFDIDDVISGKDLRVLADLLTKRPQT